MSDMIEMTFFGDKVIDPVCGTEVHDGEAAAQPVMHKGATYFFCAPECKKAFEKDPEKYVRLLRFASNEW